MLGFSVLAGSLVNKILIMHNLMDLGEYAHKILKFYGI